MIIGIDPGMSGGIAFILEGGDVQVTKMPETEKDLVDIFADHIFIEMVFIEKVHSMPRQGVSSTFKFGYNCGLLNGVITALGFPKTLVTPQVWQKYMGCLSGGDKNVTKQRAQQLFPELKITHATADALLIAEYGRRKIAETTSGR